MGNKTKTANKTKIWIISAVAAVLVIAIAAVSCVLIFGNNLGAAGNNSSAQSGAGTVGMDYQYVEVQEDISKTIDFNADLSLTGKGYTNNGETLKVTQSISLDLNSVRHYDKPGYIFLGWKKNGEYVKSGNFSAGDTLTAEYAAFSNDEFGITALSVKTDNPNGLQFTITRKDSFLNKLGGSDKVKEYGSIMLSTYDTHGKEIYLGVPAKGYEGSLYKEIKTPVAVKGDATKSDISGGIEYVRTAYNLPAEDYYKFFTVKAYVVYTDNNGIEQVAYSVYNTANLYKAALTQLAGDKKGDEVLEGVVNYVKNDRVKNYLAENYDNRVLLSGYDSTEDKDPNHAMYKLSNGLKVREVNIDWNYNDADKDESDPIEIVQVSDSHFNYCNAQDFLDANPTVMSTLEYRTWLANGKSVENNWRAMEYASMFDRTVVTGDLIDYLSWGCLEIAQKHVFDLNISVKDVPQQIFAVLGNHEPVRQMQGKVGESDSIEARYKVLKENWINDVSYQSEIVTNDNGKNPVMIMMLDNGMYKYMLNDAQIKKMEADLKTARSRNIPVLIFQHQPIATNNRNSAIAAYFDSTSSQVGINLYTSGIGIGSDSVSKRVHKVITDNADIIRGVFCGHEHEHAYCEILGTDANQTIIPQHILKATPYDEGCALKISVK